MRHFLGVGDVENPKALIDKALQIKKDPFAQAHLGKNKTLGLIFFNASIRTRLSTQRAAQNLGLQTIVMNIDQEGWGLEFEDGAVMNGHKAEHIREAAAVMGQYCEIIGVRAFAKLQDRQADYAETVLRKFQQFAGVPIISLESEIRHPLQSLTDLITIEEWKPKPKPKVVLTWAPHPKALPQAVANSLVEWLHTTDYEWVIAHPEGYALADEFVKGAPTTHDQNAALANADFVYAKNWSSYRQYGQVLHQDPSWTITPAKMQLTNQAKFMHCLPVRRNVIVADAVLDSDASIVVQQAANRVWAAQAVLTEILHQL
jgi:N-succinyl-L-ornithine transcarbamylase